MTDGLLGQDGAIARHIEGFQPRPQQQAMAQAITELLQAQGVLVIEAGTGVGKTFAYLAPVLASGTKAILSTGSKTLQDQLFFKDLPLIRKALGAPLKTALLKGRSNYLCLHRLNLTLLDGRLSERRAVRQLSRIRDWAGVTRTGDVAEMTGISRESELWPAVTSTVENCQGVACGDYHDCFVVQARRKAMEADVVVVNHHLFFADMVLKEDGFGELLPEAQLVVLDEAHQIPDIVSTFFSETLSSRQLQEWIRDTRLESLESAADMPQIREQLNRLDKVILDLRLVMDAPGQRAPWQPLHEQAGVLEQTTLLQQSLDLLADYLGQAVERSQELASSLERLQQFRHTLQHLQQPQADRVQWYETFTRGFALTSTPLDVAGPLQRCMETLPCRWVLTSATLAVGDSFRHFVNRLGLSEAVTLRLDSPFDYWRNALLYLPPDLPEPRHPDFVSALVQAAVPVIEACGGRTFMLFTSYRALHEAAVQLEGLLEFPLLVQGESPPRDMIGKFRSLGNAVLLGTASFWEGVDVRGEALSCVIIDKLPFAAPNDPVLEARLDSLRRQGENPFLEHQLPQAVISLKQGVGRLIRDQQDRGVLVLCDTRLLSRSYGRQFLDSLPRMPRTRKLAVVQRFFASHEPIAPDPPETAETSPETSGDPSPPQDRE
ncbi:MAG TPA: ATP-dependent DNA helicase [Thiolinea sp.]|nr:ATP-dependent DNA helicase [Thiolinea sp.]